MKLISAVAIQK